MSAKPVTEKSNRLWEPGCGEYSDEFQRSLAGAPRFLRHIGRYGVGSMYEACMLDDLAKSVETLLMADGLIAGFVPTTRHEGTDG